MSVKRDRGRVSWARWAQGWAFCVTGVALLATSAIPPTMTEYSKDVDPFQTVLDNTRQVTRVRFVMTQREAEAGDDQAEEEGPAVTEADFVLTFSAQHDTLVVTDTDTPWLWATLLPVPTELDGAGPGDGAFVTGSSIGQTITLDEEGQAEIGIELRRIVTAENYDSTVTWQAGLTAFVPSKENEQKELPWDVEVIMEDE